jgi:hypothetical protein
MNVVFTYKRTEAFSSGDQEKVDVIPFSPIPEMRTVKEYDEEGKVVAATIPYQANIETQEQFDYMKTLLSQFGELNIIGVWDDQGEIVEFDTTKYCDALKDIEEFEEKVFINGEDFTGREEEFERTPLKNESGEDIIINDEPVYEEFTYNKIKVLKSTRRPTLTEAKSTDVNVFNNEFKRKLN